MKTFLCLALWAAASFCSSGAIAQDNPTVAAIVAQQQQIRAEVRAGSGRYKDMPVVRRNELMAKQDDLLRMLDGKQSFDQLPEGQRLEAVNTLEWIAATVNDAENERMVCTHEKRLGSNRTERVCRTVAQMEEAQAGARDAMLKMSKGGPRLGD